MTEPSPETPVAPTVEATKPKQHTLRPKRSAKDKATLPRRSKLVRPEVRRLARRGGVRRITQTGNESVTEETNVVLRDYVRQILHHVVTMTEGNGRKTVRQQDVLQALRYMGRPLYT